MMLAVPKQNGFSEPRTRRDQADVGRGGLDARVQNMDLVRLQSKETIRARLQVVDQEHAVDPE
jgi:hypothetical protein